MKQWILSCLLLFPSLVGWGQTEVCLKLATTIGRSPAVYYQGSLYTPDSSESSDSCTLRLPCKQGGYAWLYFGHQRCPLYVEPGGRIVIESRQEGNGLKLSVSGTQVEMNAFLNAPRTASIGEREYSMTYEHFKYAVGQNSLYEDSLVEASELPRDLVTLEKKRLQFKENSLMAAYYTFHNRILEQQKQYGAVPSQTNAYPAAYFEELERRLADDEAMLRFPEYIEGCKLSCQAIVQGNNRQMEPSLFMNRYAQYIDEHFTSPRVKEVLLNEVLFPYVDANGIAGIEDADRIFRRCVTDAGWRSAYEASYEKWNRIMPGKPFPDFSFKDMDGKTYTKQDFKGKLVYIDLWATWCPPCCAEIPYMNRLEKEFAQDERIVFVSISLDKDVEAWKKKIADAKMGGVQLIAGPDCLLQDYTNQTAIPHYLLMDKDGNFIDANAPRPSDSEFTEKLRQLLH